MPASVQCRPEDGCLEWPVKTRDIHSHHFDSTIWNDFSFRPGDIIIATYAKSGTTWMQQIVAQLVFRGAADIPVAEVSPWIDLRFPPAAEKLRLVEQQQHRRFLKTHLPLDALVYSKNAKYIYVGRDGRDVALSLHNHHLHANDLWYSLLNETPGLQGPPMPRPAADVRTYFLQWLHKDGYPFWPFWENVRSWWRIRSLPNLLLVHFDDLLADLPGQIRRVAQFLEIDIPVSQFARVVQHCEFKHMRDAAHLTAPFGGELWTGGGQRFINRGTNGRWRAVLKAADIEEYEWTATDQLGPACAEWLACGDQPAEMVAPQSAGAFVGWQE